MRFGDFLEWVTGPFRKDEKTGERSAGFFEGLHMHFHISINLVQKERTH